MTDDNQEIIDRIEKAKANKDKLPHVGLKPDKDFIESYARISDMSTEQVNELLLIQDKQCTKYSRVKTCMELWHARGAEIEALREEVSDAENIIHDILMKCVNSENIIDVIAYIYEVQPVLESLNQHRDEYLAENKIEALLNGDKDE